MPEFDYIVHHLDGDYAYLQREDAPDEELKCVARALLPEQITERSKLHYAMLEYTLQ